MTILTRDNLIDGSYRSGLAMPSHLSWSEAELEASLRAILDTRPDGAIWVFAYGSLMWNPLFAFEEQRAATLDGWHRSFCLRSVSGRGSAERPGRVLALEAGGAVQGVALRLHDDLAAAELRLLWRREMMSGDYRPRWARLLLEDGREVAAIAFVVNPDQPLYEADATVETVARIVAEAAGVFGANVDYVHALDAALTARGLRDPYVEAIIAELKRGHGAAPNSAA